ncbi:unnamed protein product [Bemisia tabaci]|uniref:Uncharacterized protein n=1 Tax=Bemisia tabaci TaxID=7038 RepID=A0A9P0AL26_BEMTA|nr:PREDICTED: uncharacterized protein LOC109040926 [Bemisia tabaci]CAH0394097.1 unnamed protein product [Bemisia tabaci]
MTHTENVTTTPDSETNNQPEWEKKLEKLKGETSTDPTDDLETLKTKNGRIQHFLNQIIDMLKEKHILCINLDKQNKALTTQTESLKEITNITKDLLNIRNMEVGHLKEDMEKLQGKITQERERQKLMLNKMDTASTLNDKLKTEYHTQMNLFQTLKDKYEQRVNALIRENVELRKKLGLNPENAETAAKTPSSDVASS